MKIVLLGGAGLVGQNLVTQLQGTGVDEVVVVDKHCNNLAILRELHPWVCAVEADLAEAGQWQGQLEGAEVAVILQAQIGAKDSYTFRRNNVDATRRIVDAIRHYQVPYTVHVSSSVVESGADDDYTRTKREQEILVRDSELSAVILRPTLMFGWFDRKHLGWLSRFMTAVPVFPIPGHGRYMRQPLYVQDLCRIIISCIKRRPVGTSYDISGRERLDYIDIIRAVKKATGARSLIVKIPYWLFHFLLKTWSLFDSDPPFTTDQLRALVANDNFEVIDWPGIFDVQPTPFQQAVQETFNHPRYSAIVLQF